MSRGKVVERKKENRIESTNNITASEILNGSVRKKKKKKKNTKQNIQRQSKRPRIEHLLFLMLPRPPPRYMCAFLFLFLTYNIIFRLVYYYYYSCPYVTFYVGVRNVHTYIKCRTLHGLCAARTRHDSSANSDLFAAHATFFCAGSSFYDDTRIRDYRNAECYKCIMRQRHGPRFSCVRVRPNTGVYCLPILSRGMPIYNSGGTRAV